MTIVLTWLWQGVALAALTAMLLGALPRLNAATRHVTWWATLVAVLGIPVVLAAGARRQGMLLLPLVPGTGGLDPALVLPAAPQWLAVGVASAWAVAAVVAVIRVARGCLRVQALRDRSTPFDSAREARLPLWMDAGARAPRRMTLRTSEEVAGACALGFRRPVILVGRRLAEGLDDRALDLIVMHEYAHLARYDDWVQLLQALARAVAGLHPAVWWLSCRIDVEREAACDDHVVARTGAARQYAWALLDAATTAGSPGLLPAIVPGATARVSVLRWRVARLLDPRRARDARPTPITAFALVLPALAFLACPQLAPLVAFVDAIEHALPLPGGLRPQAGGDPTLAASTPGGIDPAPAPVLHASREAAGTSEDRRPRRAPGDSQETASLDAHVGSATPPEPVVPALIESRTLSVGVHGPLVPAMPVGIVGFASLSSARGQSPWHALATSSTHAANATASAVASGAARGGLSVGRAVTRAGHAVAARF
jgi:beta-lactamase regulating signal transducer with metallopeptidase domain